MHVSNYYETNPKQLHRTANQTLYDVSTYDMIMLIFNQETVTQRHELNLKTGHGRHTMSQTDEL